MSLRRSKRKERENALEQICGLARPGGKEGISPSLLVCQRKKRGSAEGGGEAWMLCLGVESI